MCGFHFSFTFGLPPISRHQPSKSRVPVIIYSQKSKIIISFHDIMWQRSVLGCTVSLFVSLTWHPLKVACFSPLASPVVRQQTLESSNRGADNAFLECFLPKNVDNQLSRRIIGCQQIQLHMAKRKMSMAEKRRRRAKQMPSKNQDLPPSKLDFKTPSKVKPTSAEPQTTSGEPSTPGIDGSKKITDPKVASQRAQQLLEAQRVSVDMLTQVRERVELLPSEAIKSAFEEKGYFVMDDFLQDESIISQLEQEGTSMLSHMELDMAASFGGGEYIVPIEGGEKQYTQCPRLVELVVSTTKHVPDQLESITSMDPKACMATLRTFDRKSFKASLALTGSGDTADEEKTIQAFTEQRPIGIIATEQDDQRICSLYYYVVPSTWNENCGGGISFFSDTSNKVEDVDAKRDRLVILKSNSCHLRRMPWRGSDEGNEVGSCVELNLVRKQE